MESSHLVDNYRKWYVENVETNGLFLVSIYLRVREDGDPVGEDDGIPSLEQDGGAGRRGAGSPLGEAASHR
jgi:hypothetical protein